MGKKPLHPTLAANRDRLKRGESLHGRTRASNKKAAAPQKQKVRIRSKQKKG